MIAITGANGNLGRATVSFLFDRTVPRNIVAVVRDASKVQDYAEAGIQVRVADYNDPASMRRAFGDVEKVLQISTSSYGEQAMREEQNVVRAAKEQDVKHIVYTSILKPGDHVHFLAGRVCGNTERLIKNSGMHYTIFRNSMYFELIPFLIGSALKDGQVYYPGGRGKVSYISMPDIAEALANVLTGGNHRNVAYNITGSEAYGFDDIAGMLHSEKGIKARYIDVPAKAYHTELLKFGMSGQEADFHISMANSVKAHEFSQTDDVIEKLLQRRRRTLPEFIRTI
ncbi:NAD(P)H-binding protein [Chitinophaga barathri]|uniref:NAD-dependent epimerase/dehydratase family protein n=1 Tax=Chitinophaga barathri TaxID=1647451 RepID=A0A3N4MMP6_9BACT|nr:NAD(P)H-binding protein [Chitinophaga barathri]RPD40879.1 NAD-dependent epimerase/dehydratase family protein [Chitinophaga barathri]